MIKAGRPVSLKYSPIAAPAKGAYTCIGAGSDAFAATEGQADLIHVSVLPWLNFSSFSHAFTHGQSNGIPKFVFGQYNTETGKMPLAIDVHHALLDGLHVAKFIKQLQYTFNNLSNNN